MKSWPAPGDIEVMNRGCALVLCLGKMAIRYLRIRFPTRGALDGPFAG
jgi:hypothetical protein